MALSNTYIYYITICIFIIILLIILYQNKIIHDKLNSTQNDIMKYQKELHENVNELKYSLSNTTNTPTPRPSVSFESHNNTTKPIVRPSMVQLFNLATPLVGEEEPNEFEEELDTSEEELDQSEEELHGFEEERGDNDILDIEDELVEELNELTDT